VWPTAQRQVKKIDLDLTKNVFQVHGIDEYVRSHSAGRFEGANGSWAIKVTKPNRLTCLVASGQSWEELPPDGDDT